MLFNSLQFLIFFPVVFLGYWALPHSSRRLFLLLASCYFYAVLVPKYIFILFFIITADYFLAFFIEKHNGRKRLLFLVISIFINLSTLFFFKYFNFFNENLASLASLLHWNYAPTLLQIVLPLGLSFHVFQSLSYVIEVYKKKYTPERNYITYALYVMFFPQLVAGPIERPQHLLPQLSAAHVFDPVLARKGLERMLWGFFKKLVIADQIGQIINPFYTNVPGESPLLIVMTILFLYQLYCDFSGYADIALGSAQMLGITLCENFNRPFAARSVTEFWRRWHISLSSWVKDYLYYPLVFGFGKVSKLKLSISLFITFILVGLWHGANWNFITFGAIHGLYLVFEFLTERTRKSVTSFFRIDTVKILHHTIQVVITFVLVAISCIFFRAESNNQAWWIVTHLFSNIEFNFIRYHLVGSLTKIVGNVVFAFVMISIVAVEIVQYLQAKQGDFYIFDKKPKILRYVWYACITWSILLFGYFDAQTFIYFQF